MQPQFTLYNMFAIFQYEENTLIQCIYCLHVNKTDGPVLQHKNKLNIGDTALVLIKTDNIL